MPLLSSNAFAQEVGGTRYPTVTEITLADGTTTYYAARERFDRQSTSYLDQDDIDDAPVFHPTALNDHLVQVTIEDIHAAQTAIELLMGSSVPPRKAWLIEQMGEL